MDGIAAVANGGAERVAVARLLDRWRRAAPVVVADLAIDPVDRVATRAGRPLPLHPREFALLLALARAGGRPLDRRTLLASIWGRDFDPGTNVVAVTVSRLRAKLDVGRAPLLRTVADGYRLAAPD